MPTRPLSKGLNQRDQAILFSLRIDTREIVTIKTDNRSYSAYYYHLKYKHPQELSSLIKKLKALKLIHEICAKFSSMDDMNWSIVLIRIPNLHVRYLSRGSSQTMQDRVSDIDIEMNQEETI